MKKMVVNVVVTRDEMVYMVQRIVANMEEKMLNQIFRDKVMEGIQKVCGIVDEDDVTYTNSFISVPVRVIVEETKTEADITSALASCIYEAITDLYKVASVFVSTDTCESVSCAGSDGNIAIITKAKSTENTKTSASL